MSARATGWVGGGRPRSASRRGRLSRSADFDRVFRNGRSQAGRELVRPRPTAWLWSRVAGDAHAHGALGFVAHLIGG